MDKYIIPNVGLDMPIYHLSVASDLVTLELVEKRKVNKALQARYNLVSKLQQPETQVIGIVVGTVVVNEYMELINKLKEVIVRAGKKPYEMLVGKLNEPKLRNLAIIDLYVLVSCRETSLIDPREFMTQVLTPHEVFMALMPSRFPWQCKITTDFRQVLR